MSGNALQNTLGITRIRCNGGATLTARGTLRVVGGTVTDRLALRTTQVVDVENARVRIDVTIAGVEGEDGVDVDPFSPTGWSSADDVYVSADVDGVRIASFGQPATVQRKQLIVTGSHAIELRNWFPEIDDPTPYSAGRIQSIPRILSPGDAARLVFDTVSQLWLVNDGMFSGQYLTHDNELITHDGSPITTF